MSVEAIVAPHEPVTEANVAKLIAGLPSAEKMAEVALALEDSLSQIITYLF